MFNSVSSATLADITSDSKGNCTGVDDCTLHLTFGANLDQKRLPTGNYSTSLTYTATSKPAPYVPPTPPDPTPYVPPKPRWTTNGCYYDGDNWRNCGSFNEPNVTQKVVWRGDAWYVIKADMWGSWFNYNNYNATWAHAAILTESGKQKYISMHGYDSTVQSAKLDSNDIVKILAYVPAYSRQGNYINFCRRIDTTLHTCEYSDVSDDFNLHYDNNEGFWVGLRAMGCTNVPDESKCGYNDHCDMDDALGGYNYYTRANAKKVADTLTEALGSPCY